MELFGGIYKNKTVLITGNTGFKGSWLALWLIKLGANVVGYSKDTVSNPSHYSILELKHKTYFKNILDSKSLNTVFSEHKPDIVFHLAAQSLVRESYVNPIETYQTNVLGTLCVLEAARKCKNLKVFINVTTDKVYENIEALKPYKETDRLGGFDLYSSSKACSEILTSAYRNSFLKNKFLLTTARAGNVIGGGDWAKDRLIPDIITATSQNKICEIRNPNSIRPWQHVLDSLSGYLLLSKKLLENKKEFIGAWNFGPAQNNGITVKELLQKSKKEWDNIQFSFLEDTNFHEASLLNISSLKANKLLGWKPVWSTNKAVEKTVNWYKNYYLNKAINTSNDLENYIDDAKKKKNNWAI